MSHGDKVDRIYKALAEGIVKFTEGHDIHTPRTLVEEIIRNIELNGDMLVMFNIEFVVSLVYTYNIDPASITFYSDNEDKTNIATKLGVKYITTIGTDMKFDVILANPPYQSGNKEKGGRHSLWRKFVKQGFNLVKKNGFVAMVCPGFPYKASDLSEQFTKNTPLVLVNDASHHFPGVGSKIKYWIVKEGIHKIPFTVDGAVWINGLKDDPTQDPVVISITKKIQGLPTFECKQDRGYSSTQLKNDSTDYFKVPTGNSTFPIRHASTVKVCYVSKPTEGHTKNKVMMTFSGYPDFEYLDGQSQPMSSCYQMSGYIEVNNSNEGHQLINLYKTKFYTFLSNLSGAGMRGIENYSLPALSLTTCWTDADLYAHFRLTQDEINYVEATVK